MNEKVTLALAVAGILISIARNWNRIRQVSPTRVAMGVGLVGVLLAGAYLAETTGAVDELSRNAKYAILFGTLLFGGLVGRIVSPSPGRGWARLVIAGALFIGGLMVAAGIRERSERAEVSGQAIPESATASAVAK